MANPFKTPEAFEEEIKSFLIRHKTFVANQAGRISDYFEMCCYNHIVKYYENSGFEVTVENLIGEKFRYKLSPSGYPSNFSFFKISKRIKDENKTHIYEFEIHHNLTVQSAIEKEIYLTPDISVINVGSILEEETHYLVEKSSKRFCYVANSDLQTFCEVKQFNPFPELLFSFNGMYIEMIDSKTTRKEEFPIKHIAPSLMLSGKGNVHTEKIKLSLESRNKSNIIFDLFETGNITFSRNFVSSLFSISSQNALPQEVESLIDEEDLPF
jgi:hypothetical protein